MGKKSRKPTPGPGAAKNKQKQQRQRGSAEIIGGLRTERDKNMEILKTKERQHHDTERQLHLLKKQLKAETEKLRDFFPIVVKPISKPGTQFVVYVTGSTTILDVKEKIYRDEAKPRSKPPAWQRIFFAGKHLDDDRTLASCNVQEGTSIFLHETERANDAIGRAEVEEMAQGSHRAEEISVAVAKAKAAAKAALPNEESSANRRFLTALFALRDAIVIDDDDQANFDDYMNSTGRDDMSAEHRVKIVARWPRLRKYWPRLRRRICSACGKGTLDLSEPRLLVCGGCGEGRAVGRYCSEDCQRAHWPEHQKECFKFHALPADLRPMLGNKSGRDTLVKRWMESMENGLTLEEAVEDSLCV